MFCAYDIAVSVGKDLELCSAFARNTWGRGADVGTDVDLRKLCEEVGISWEELEKKISISLTSDFWRELPEKNLELMKSFGFWGVPCIAYDGVMVWGNDKIWVIEDILHEERSVHLTTSTIDASAQVSCASSDIRQIFAVG
jgi:2-hydroxychromene-2-carboxylate isomerase